MTSKIAKWEKWVELACSDCGNLMLCRDMFLDLHNMIAKNEQMQQNDYFHVYMRDTYVAHALMMLRKHKKTSPDSISLTSAVSDMLKNIDQLPEKSVAGGLQQAFTLFTDKAEKIEGFADRVIAHGDRRAPKYIPTYSEIDEAIDSMDQLAIQASLAVGARYSDTCRPTVQGGWLNVFRDMGIEA